VFVEQLGALAEAAYDNDDDDNDNQRETDSNRPLHRRSTILQ